MQDVIYIEKNIPTLVLTFKPCAGNVPIDIIYGTETPTINTSNNFALLDIISFLNTYNIELSEDDIRFISLAIDQCSIAMRTVKENLTLTIMKLTSKTKHAASNAEYKEKLLSKDNHKRFIQYVSKFINDIDLEQCYANIYKIGGHRNFVLYRSSLKSCYRESVSKYSKTELALVNVFKGKSKFTDSQKYRLRITLHTIVNTDLINVIVHTKSKGTLFNAIYDLTSIDFETFCNKLHTEITAVTVHDETLSWYNIDDFGFRRSAEDAIGEAYHKLINRNLKVIEYNIH